MLFAILGFSMSLTFLLGIRSFVTVWIGKENYILFYLTIVFFTLAIFLNIIYYPLLALVNANGLFKDNKRHIFICAATNLVLSIILINFFGINGILFATALSFLINTFLKTKLISKKILKSVPHLELIKKYSLMIIIFILCCIILYKPESIILNMTTSLPLCIITIVAIFIFISMIVVGTLYLLNKDTRNLVSRIIKLIKRKL